MTGRWPSGEVALRWGLYPARQLCSTLVRCTPISLLWSAPHTLLPPDLVWSCETSSVFQLRLGNCGHQSSVKKKVCSLSQMRTPNPHSLIGPKYTVLVGWTGAALIGQWRFYWWYSCTALIGSGKVSVLLFEAQSSFISFGSGSGNTVGRRFNEGFSLKCGASEAFRNVR